jgi:hypothetical protein
MTVERVVQEGEKRSPLSSQNKRANKRKLSTKQGVLVVENRGDHGVKSIENGAQNNKI